MLEGLLDRSEIRVGDLRFDSPHRQSSDMSDLSVWAKNRDFSFVRTDLAALEQRPGPGYQRLVNTTKILAAMKYLKPSLVSSLDIQNNLPDASFVALFSGSTGIEIKRQTLESLSLLYPDFTQSPDLKRVISRTLPEIKADFNSFMSDRNRMLFESDYSKLREAAIILKANSIPLNLPDFAYEYLAREFERSKDFNYRVSEKPEFMAQEATLLKVLFPDVPQTDYFTAEDLAFVRKSFKQHTKNPERYINQPEFAFNLQLLFAEKIDFTSDGIKLVTSMPFSISESQVPEVRQF